MKNKMLMLAAIITVIFSNLYGVFAEDNSSPNGFSWRYEPTENLKAGDDITVFADGLEVPHNLILALYQDRKLVDLCVNTGESVTVTLPDNFSDDAEWKFKTFVWDSLSSMIPLEDCLEVKLVTNIDITYKFTDVNFLNAVRDIIGKSEKEAIYKSDVENITALDIHDKGIQSLDGIEYFTSLEKLKCWSNNLISLDVSKNKNLKELYCYNNNFLSLDFSDNTKLELLDFGYNTDILSLNISNNTALKVLACHYTSLTSLDIANAPYLTELYCYGSQLENLDVSNNVKLQKLDCWGNRFTILDVSKNTELTYLDCGYNRINTLNISDNKELMKLDCSGCQMLSVDDVKGWHENGLILGDTFIFDPQDEIITDKFTDINFLNAVREAVGKTEEEPIYRLDVEYIEELDVSHKNITSLDGIEYFTYLEGLNFSYNTKLTPPNLSKNEYLKILVCAIANLETLDLSNNRYLEHLDCSNNLKLESINITNNIELKDLYCNYSKISSLDVTHNINLTTLACYSTQITQLDISNNINLQRVNCRSNKLTELNISKNNKLTGIDCSYNKIETIDVSNNTELTRLYCDGNSLTGLDVSENKNLERLSCANNQMNSVDDVKGWENVGLILGDTFTFDPQRSIQ